MTFSTNTALPEFLNAQDYIGWHNKAREMDGLAPVWTDEVIAKMKADGTYGETDWVDLLFKNYGFTHQHNISATGGNDRIKHYTSVGLMNQDGIVPEHLLQTVQHPVEHRRKDRPQPQLLDERERIP